MNGALTGATTGAVFGTAEGIFSGNWRNFWKRIGLGAAYGAAAGLAFGTLTEAGYKLQLKHGRTAILNSKVTESAAGRMQDDINGFNDQTLNIYSGVIQITHYIDSGETVVDFQIAPDQYWTPPQPYIVQSR